MRPRESSKKPSRRLAHFHRAPATVCPPHWSWLFNRQARWARALARQATTRRRRGSSPTTRSAPCSPRAAGQRRLTLTATSTLSRWQYNTDYAWFSRGNSEEEADKSHNPLKGQCHKIFCFRFFSWIIFPQAPENNTKVISNFFKNSWKYLQVKGTTGSMTPVANVPRVSTTPVEWHQRQICHRYQQHQRQILPPVPLVLLMILCQRCSKK